MPVSNELKIALGFSGGGYRAAAFNLGVLSYLNQVKTVDGSLLENVNVISTVSGGTITGTRYAIGIKNGEAFGDFYWSLYRFMLDVDLMKLSLERLTSKEGWGEGRVKSLINAVADVYDKHLYDGAKFSVLMEETPDIHLKHLSFNATEFANALQFRFQWSEPIIQPGPDEPGRGIIGNRYYNIPQKLAKEIRMADILAASSCFPGGFEPINFPSDFVLTGSGDIQQFNQNSEFPVGLMDGGIVDNQGIEPILLAEQRMKRNLPPGHTGNALSLVVVSDVASPYMEEYIAAKQGKLNWWRRLTPARIITINTMILLAAAGLLWWNARAGNLGWSIAFTALATVSLLVYLFLGTVKSLPRKFDVPGPFLKPIRSLLKLRLQVYENLVRNRVASLLKMSGEVFLKHVRRLNYRMLYSDPSWENRRIMNAIYELRDGEDRLKQKLAKGEISAGLMPSPAVQQVAGKAASMGTTLWFTGSDQEKAEMLDALIACGQFTMCWSFLELFERFDKNPVNLDEGHQLLLQCREQMKAEWEEFQEDPYWLVKKQKIIVKTLTGGEPALLRPY